MREKTAQAGPKATTQKEESKENKDQSTLPKGQSSAQEERKDGTSYDPNQSEIEQSDDENKQINKEKNERLQKELDQVIYISISETPTNIMFYCPSTKYLTLKNGKW